METVVTLTMNPAVDINTAIDQVVAERKLRCDEAAYEPGGGGINVSRAIRKLGGESMALYPTGGPTGGILGALLDEERISRASVPTESWTRENFIVFERSSERQFRFGTPGPVLQEAEWKACLDLLPKNLQHGGILVLSGSLPRNAPADFYAQAVRGIRSKGIRVVLDTSGKAFGETLREAVFLIKPNLRELKELVGDPLSEETDQERAALELVNRGSTEVVVVSLGAAGIILASNEGVRRLRAPTVPIRSKVGAGDSMVAGIVFHLARGASVHEAACYGLAAGSAAVMTPGSELCRKEDTERLYRRLLCYLEQHP